MRNKENQSLIVKLLKKINFYNNNQSLRDSIQDVIDEKVNDKDYKIDLSNKEKSILTNILSINKLKVDDVMIPRASIIAVSQDCLFKDIIKIIRKEIFGAVGEKSC